MLGIKLTHSRMALLLGVTGLIACGADWQGCSLTTTADNSSGETNTAVQTPQVNTPPTIAFASPTANTTATVGDTIKITFDAQDPENSFTYDLVWDTDTLKNGNEQTIEAGSKQGSSVVQVSWNTTGLAAQVYYIGVYVTDSGGNYVDQYVGPITLNAKSGITVTSPSGSLAIAAGQTVAITFSSSAADSSSTIDVFYDNDNNFSNGVSGTISEGLTSSATSTTWNTTGITEGTYFIGASIGRSGSSRTAAYASGQVMITPTAAALSSLSIRMTQPEDDVIVDQGGTVQISFRGTDPVGTATINLFYDTDSDYDNGVTNFITGLPSTRTLYTWTVGIPVGQYYVGATIGLPDQARLAAYATGMVTVRAAGSSGGSSGGGSSSGGSTTIETSLRFLTPAEDVVIGNLDRYLVSFRLNPQSAQGTLKLEYAVDIDKNGQPDVGNSWTTFATVAPSISSQYFNASYSMAASTYAIRGTFTPAADSSYIGCQTVASAWITILTERTVVVSSPSSPQFVDRSSSQASSIMMRFAVTNPALSDYIDAFIDTDLVAGGEQVFATSRGTGTMQLTDTQVVLSNPAALTPGLYFLGISLGVDATSRTYVYAPAALYVYVPGDPNPNPLSVIEPSEDTTLMQGEPLNVKWFVKDPATGSTMNFFREGVKSDGTPNGTRSALLPADLDPVLSSQQLLTGSIPAGQYFIGATYSSTGNADVVVYAEGKVRIVPNTAQSIVVTAPIKDQVVTAGAAVTVTYEGTDPVGVSTIDLFYDNNNQFDYSETYTLTGLAETSQATSASVVMPTPTGNYGLYWLGATISRDPSSRLSDYADGRVLVRAAGAPLPGLLLPITPAINTTILTGKNMDLLWYINSPSIPTGSTVTWFYQLPDALDNPDTTTTVELAADVAANLFIRQISTSAINAAHREKWLHVGLTYERPGEAAVTVYATGRLRVVPADATIDIDVTEPANNFVINAGTSFNLRFSAVDEIGGSTVNIFRDTDPLYDGNEVNTVIGLSPTASTATISTAGLTPGVYFFGANIGLNTLQRQSHYSYAPSHVLVKAANSPAPDLLTVWAPTTNTTVIKGAPIDVKWFVNTPTIPGGSTVTIFYQQLDTYGNPTGAHVDLATGLDPLTCFKQTSTDNVVNTGEYLALGVTYSNDGSPVTKYTTGRIRVLSNADRFVSVATPDQNIVATIGTVIPMTFLANDPAGLANVNLFLDRDGVFNGNETISQSDLAWTETGGWVSTAGMKPGVYFLGASIGQGQTGRTADYADGRLLLQEAGAEEPDLLTVVAPIAPRIIVSNGSSFGVRWFVNSTILDGTITIVAEREDGGASITAPDHPSPHALTYTFDAASMVANKWYRIRVDYTPTDGSPVSVYAPGRVYAVDQSISVGDISDDLLRGTVFEGVNFNDHAGSNVAPVADIDGDGTGDLIIVSQFGKPELEHIDGAGIGEAYLIYGSTDLEGKRIKLNSTGVQLPGGTPGLTFTGVTNLDDTDAGDVAGIHQVIPIPDQDDDGAPELVFSTLETSLGSSRSLLFKKDEFLRGGIVVVSSTDNFFYNRTETWTEGSRRIRLDSVGFDFASIYTYTPFDQAGYEDDYGYLFWDTDNDGVYDDGDESGVLGDNPCTTGETSGCDDNCRAVANSSQTDTDGDGAGDDCDADPADAGVGTDLGASTAPGSEIDNPYTTCAWMGVVGARSVGCQETLIDTGIGFYSELVQDPSRPIWRNGNYYDPRNGVYSYNTGCDCPIISVLLDDIMSDWKYGGPRGEITESSAPYLEGLHLSTGFITNASRRQFGMRILGQGMGDRFGQSLSFVDGMLLVGAPNYSPDIFQDSEAAGFAAREIKGRAYEIGMTNLPNRQIRPLMYGYKDRTTSTVVDRDPGPRPYQYIVGKHSGSVAVEIMGALVETSGLGYAYPSYVNGDGSPFDGTTYISNSAARTDESIGYDIKGTPDFNGDGLGETLVGAPDAFNTDDSSGAAYLLYRRDWLLYGDRDLDAVEQALTSSDRLFGVMIRGRAGEHFGKMVGTGQNNNGRTLNYDENAGPIDYGDRLDFNHDGLSDIVMGNQHFDTNRGEIVILYGNTNLETPAGGYRIDELVTHNLGTVIRGEAEQDLAGYNVAFAGDFDGDGFNDLLVSAPNATAGGNASAGKVYLILGSNHIMPGSTLSLADVGTSTLKGLVFTGQVAGDMLGGGEIAAYDGAVPGSMGSTGMRAKNISWAGDVNNDGYSDILLGAPLASPGTDGGVGGVEIDAGEAYLIYGYPID